MFKTLRKYREKLVRALSHGNGEEGAYHVSLRPNFVRKKRTDLDLAALYADWISAEPKSRLDLARFYMLVLQARALDRRGVPGAVAELGVYKGTTAKLFRTLCPHRDLHLFDTFSGFDPRDAANQNENTANDMSTEFKDTSVEAVMTFVGV